VALIRGINVGRAKRVSMADLRALMEGLGFRDCRTLLNSGNLVFDADGGSPTAIGSRIERAMEAELGVAARVIVLSADELAAVVEGNRLPRTANNPSRVLVAFVGKAAELSPLRELEKQSFKPELLAVGARAAYLWCPGGVGRSPLAEAVGGVLGARVTTRNWATVGKLRGLL
jgi:uncharacterized protein (DUF1697 family)